MNWEQSVYFPSAADYVPPPDPVWWLGRLLPAGGIMCLSALSKVGKSWLAAEITRAITTGDCFASGTEFNVMTPAKVLYLDAELGEWSFYTRWKQYDPDKRADRNLAVVRDPDMDFTSDTDVTALKVYAEKNGYNVLVVDPINCFTSGSIVDPDSVARFINNVRKILRYNKAHGTAAILIGHNNKPSKPQGNWTPDPLDPYAMTGGNWFNKCDTMVTVNRDGGYSTKWDEAGREYWDIEAKVLVRHGRPVDNLELRICPENVPPVISLGALPPPAPGSFRMAKV